MLIDLLYKYGFDAANVEAVAFGNGLINHTWKVTAGNQKYILQRVNDSVFKNPEWIADNITLIGKYLDEHSPDYYFVKPVAAIDGETLLKNENGYFRLFPFVEGSHSITTVETPEQAYEAARKFGEFTRRLEGLSLERLHITLPSFHDLSLRYAHFTEALKKGNDERIKESSQIIKQLKESSGLVNEYEKIVSGGILKRRVTHHDTKISNVLFDKNDKALCVIDLDTVMPGYFVSDVGDMFRTYLCPVNEEESNIELISVRDNYYEAIVTGYLVEMGGLLSETERSYFFYAGAFMIYMQALRFLTDYINNDIYYGAKYEKHNLVRATNQAFLLGQLQAKEKLLKASV